MFVSKQSERRCRKLRPIVGHETDREYVKLLRLTVEGGDSKRNHVDARRESRSAIAEHGWSNFVVGCRRRSVK